jgi:hypothetical protein
MSILSTSPLSPIGKVTDFGKGSPTFSALLAPLEGQLAYLPPLVSGSNRPLSYTFEYQIRGLVYYHIETFSSALELLQAAEEDAFVKRLLVPEQGLGKSTFYEANATRGVDQMLVLFKRLYKKASKQTPMAYEDLGALVAVDGTLIDACLSMSWADYRGGVNKVKMHTGFDLNGHIPKAIALTAGNRAERPFVSALVEPGQTAVIDRGYQDYGLFDQWIEQDRHFVARLRANMVYEVIEDMPFEQGTSLFLFAKILLGDPAHKMRHPLYLVGFKAEGKIYYIVTDRSDLSAEQIAFIFSLRWAIETFFAWWKRHMKVYHLIGRNEQGLLVQLLSGLITYLLLVIYFHRSYQKAPSLERLRELRWKIRHETLPDTRITVYIAIHIDLHLLILLWLWRNRHAIF